MKKMIFLFALILLFQSCESNPYPQAGGEIVNGKQPTQRPTAPAFSIDMQATLNFREGTVNSYVVKYFVPNGKAIINFTGLPDGMIFDEKTNKLEWTPDFLAANDPKDPTQKVKRIPVTAWLRSDLDSRTFIRKDIVVEVADTARLFKTSTTVSSKTVNEGDKHNYEFEFINEDFPTGPFTVVTRNLPQSLMVTVDQNNKARVTFQADYEFVTVSDECSYYSCKKSFSDGKIFITAPDGRSLEVAYDLTINDKRLDSKFVNPTTINQGLDVSFIVTSYDPNGEVEPLITLENTPRDGSVTFEKIDATKSELKQTHMKLTWSDIPVSRRGTSTTFKFESCTYNTRRSMSECVTQNVKVNIQEQIHKAPLLERTNWPLGKIEYLKINKKFEVKLKVKDGDDNSRSVKNVEIFPETMREMVSYRSGSLSIETDKPGIHQFKVKAISVYGIESVESFIFEVLPKDWSENIALVSNPREIENIKNRSMFNSLDFVNPDLQKLEGRIMSHRKTMLLGTDILKNKDLLIGVEKLSADMKNIIIMSPLINNFTNELSTEIDLLGINLLGRFKDVIKDPLAAFNFLIGRDVILTQPKWKIRLAGKLTSESSNPLLLKTRITSKCTEVLSLGNEATGMDYLTTAKCERENGGYLLLSSFEFGDFATNTDDQDIPKNWLSTLTE